MVPPHIFYFSATVVAASPLITLLDSMRRDNQEGGTYAWVDLGIEFCVALVRHRELRRM